MIDGNELITTGLFLIRCAQGLFVGWLLIVSTQLLGTALYCTHYSRGYCRSDFMGNTVIMQKDEKPPMTPHADLLQRTGDER